MTERQIDRGRQTDRQIDRERQTDRDTYIQTDRPSLQITHTRAQLSHITHNMADRQIDRDRQTVRHNY